MSPPTDKQDILQTSSKVSEQYETAKKDFAKVLGSQVKYYTLNLNQGESARNSKEKTHDRVKSVIADRYLLRADETKIEESNNEESKLEESRT